MRVSSRTIVTSVAAFALAVGWIGTPGASAVPASESSGARHIVVLHEDVDAAAVARDHGRRHGAEVKDVYQHALKGYVATFKGDGASDVARDPRVDFVELDQKVSINAVTSPQAGAPWGLDRIDELPGDGSFSFNATGKGVTAYIIDTGINYSHQEFVGRTSFGTDKIKASDAGADCNGHGTHVAGTVGGNTYGVAKEVGLVSVRVLDCAGSGSWSGVIGGIDWVTDHHKAGAPAVANMSLGGGASSAVDRAVSRSIADGVTYVVAAGNGNTAGVAQDACKSSPARVPEAITIGATDSSDKKASWSNFGKCVDWFAPGVNITSAWYGSTSATETISGTSMATPHTAGVVAQYLQTDGAASPSTVRTALWGKLTTGVLSSIGRGSPNGLLHTIW
jgi:subtilisin family serine protease